jgi:hypothetical protein
LDRQELYKKLQETEHKLQETEHKLQETEHKLQELLSSKFWKLYSLVVKYLKKG